MNAMMIMVNVVASVITLMVAIFVLVILDTYWMLMNTIVQVYSYFL